MAGEHGTVVKALLDERKLNGRDGYLVAVKRANDAHREELFREAALVYLALTSVFRGFTLINIDGTSSIP